MHRPGMTRKNFRHQVTRLGRGGIGLQRRNRMQQCMIRRARISFLLRQGNPRLGQTLPQWQLGALATRGSIMASTFFSRTLLGLACHKQRQAQGHRQRTRRNNQSLKMHAHGTKPPPRRCVCGFVGTAKRSIAPAALKQRAELLLKLHDVRLRRTIARSVGIKPRATRLIEHPHRRLAIGELDLAADQCPR